MARRVGMIYKQNNEFVMGDFNMRLHEDPETPADREGQLSFRTNFETQWPNLLRNIKTYMSAKGKESSIDIISTNEPRNVLMVKMLDQVDSTIDKMTDHKIWSLYLATNRDLEEEKMLLSKKKLNSENDYQIDEAKTIVQEIEKEIKIVMKRTLDPSQVLDKMISLGKSLLPIKKKKMGFQSKNLNFNYEVIKAKDDRQKYMIENKISGLGGYYTKRYPKLRSLNYKISRAKKKAKRILWERKIDMC